MNIINKITTALADLAAIAKACPPDVGDVAAIVIALKGGNIAGAIAAGQQLATDVPALAGPIEQFIADLRS